MPAFIFQRHLPGVCYARTDGGQELPVLDITHPAFAAEVVRERREDVEEEVRSESWLFAGLRDGVAPPRMTRVASALRTYRAKLGDEGLGWARWFTLLRSADGFLAEQIRCRAQSVARLLAASMVAPLSRRPGMPVHLVNIAGGAASDSLNALIVLARDRPFQVMGRAIRVHVLDVDPAGPSFARRALTALRAPGAPLARLDVELEHVPYDWNEPGRLAALVEGWRADGALLVGSSESGLVEYCPDALVLEHLRLLRDGAPPGFDLACTAWRGDEVGNAARVLRGRDQPLRSHTRESLTALAERAAWSVQWSEEQNPLHLVFLLRPR
jgi:hypothetical protein